MRARTMAASLVLVACTACFPDRTLNKACTERFPCVVDGDRCVDGVCRRGLPPEQPHEDAGDIDDAGAIDEDAGTVEGDAGALEEDAGILDEDAGVPPQG